jgi:hypothetical protein
LGTPQPGFLPSAMMRRLSSSIAVFLPRVYIILHDALVSGKSEDAEQGHRVRQLACRFRAVLILHPATAGLRPRCFVV